MNRKERLVKEILEKTKALDKLMGKEDRLRKFKEEKKEDREFVSLSYREFQVICKALGIEETVCHYCKEKITEDNYGLWNKPTRLICRSPVCVSQAIREDEERKGND